MDWILTSDLQVKSLYCIVFHLRAIVLLLVRSIVTKKLYEVFRYKYNFESYSKHTFTITVASAQVTIAIFFIGCQSAIRARAVTTIRYKIK